MRTVFPGVAAVAVSLIGLVPGHGLALAPGVPPAGSATLAPLVGTNANTFTLTPPLGAACPGDSATGGYRWQTFMTAASVDPATLTYGLTGPVVQGTEFSKPLFSNFGAPQVNKITAVTTGLLTPIPLFSWDASILPVPNGEYNIGYACTTTGTTQKFWSTPITVTNSAPTSFSYQFGSKPAAPVLASPLVSGDHTLAGSFAASASAPATTGFTVVAVPTTGVTVSVPLVAAGNFVVQGLENGVPYAVSVIASNGLGNSAPSNTVYGTPTHASPLPFVPLTPARLADTRSGAKVGNAAGTGAPLVVNVLNRGGLPGSGIGAVSLNVTVVDGGLPLVGGGYVTVYPCGTRPNASNLNFDVGQTIPNAVIAPVSAAGDVCFYVYGTAHLLVDVSAYFPATT
jgi:hypothetical protein